jgi:predicted GNAT superfamily acetyltransferase
MTAGLSVRSCHSLREFHRCVEIAREVWGDSELDTEPYITFVIADHTGGQVLGAFDGDTMIGFTKAVVGIRNASPYLHSHMTGVLPSHRDRRVGRLLKLFQLDPLETKNAHFNLNRLGAISRHYIPDFYGVTTSPLHRGMPTDRLLVEWHLDSKRVIAAISELTRDPVESPAYIHLPNPVAQTGPALSSVERSSTPASPPSPHPALQASTASPARAPLPGQVPETSALIELQSRVRKEFTEWFAKGYAATGMRFTLTGVDYCLAPWSEF